MNLGDLIARLEHEDPDAVLQDGFRNPHSYRGYYDQLAFEPAPNVRVADLLAEARFALNRAFTGYKGGEFVMRANTPVNIALYGCCRMGDSDELTEERLEEMLSRRSDAEPLSVPDRAAILARLRDMLMEVRALPDKLERLVVDSEWDQHVIDAHHHAHELVDSLRRYLGDA